MALTSQVLAGDEPISTLNGATFSKGETIPLSIRITEDNATQPTLVGATVNLCLGDSRQYLEILKTSGDSSLTFDTETATQLVLSGEVTAGENDFEYPEIDMGFSLGITLASAEVYILLEGSFKIVTPKC